MKIFMTGGTGFVGRALTQKLAQMGHEITVLTRSIREGQRLPNGASFLEGDPVKKGAWQERVADHDAIINLAGASIFMRWTDRNKKTIRDSRILTTKNLVEALKEGHDKETLFLSTSAIGYYGPHGEEDLDESSQPGDDFLASVTKEWEAAALDAESFGARVLLCRFGIVLGKKGGALEMMLPVFRNYLGSPLGSGTQWFSWIHLQDLINIYPCLMEEKELSGPINFTSPNPVRNKELTKTIGKVLKKPTFMPSVPGFVLKMVMGEFGSVLLESQKVNPGKLLDAGFRFKFPILSETLEDLLT